MKKGFFALLFSLICLNSYSQRFLAMDKGGKQKRIRFMVGDMITFKTRESKEFMTGKIENIGDSVTISGNAYSVNDFYKIRVYRDPALQALLLSGSVILPAAGILFLVSEAVSSKLHNDYPLVEADHLKLYGGLIIGGLIMYRLSYRTFKIGGNHPLKIIDVSLHP